LESYYVNGTRTPATQPVYLLVGQTKNIDPLGGFDKNLGDLSSVWITINPQTGLVSTNEMGPPGNPLQYAQEAQSMGGR
jgi:hypothetical protein